MNKAQSKNLIYGKLFLISVFVLLLNDFYLKHQFHNYLTGKLSDFAGLFAFPYFASLFFKSKIKPIYILTGILFIFWKSSSSQLVFDFLNGFGIGINRIVDYSDFIALFILPFSYHYRIKNLTGIKKLKFLPKPILIGICSFAFIATSLPEAYGELNLKSNYETEIELGFEKLKNTDLYYVSVKNDKYLSTIEIPDKKAEIETTLIIKQQPNGTLIIKLDSIVSYRIKGSGFIFGGGVDEKNIEYVENLSVEDFEKIFIEQKINTLKNK